MKGETITMSHHLKRNFGITFGLWLVLATLTLAACGDAPKNSPQTNIVGKWEQVSAQGLGQLFSATKQGDTIEFMSNGTLDLGGTGATWTILENGKLQYTVSRHSFIFDTTFSTSQANGTANQATSSNNEVLMTGGGEGGQRTVTLRRKA